jgi:hypothetical protein
MDVKCKLKKQKELTEMELAADTDSDAYEEDSCVEDNEVEAELQEEQEEAIVGEKSNWRLQQNAGSSRNAHRCTGHERGLRKSEALIINMDSSIFMLYFTAVIPLLVRSLTQDFHNIQECPHNNWA